METTDKKLNSQKGSVSIEATIALTTFLFMFIMIYSIVTVCRAQAKIQVGLNNVAKEISQYSYLYGLSGLDVSLGKFQQAGEEEKKKINNVVGSVTNVFDGISSLGTTASGVDISDVDSMLNGWDDISGQLSVVGSDFSDAKTKIEDMASDPQALLLGLTKLVGSEALEVGKSRAIAEPVSRALIRKHLKRDSGDTPGAFLKSFGVQKGTYLGTESYFNGLDFSNSTLFPYGSDEITIIVTYKVKMIQLLPVDFTFEFTQSAITKGWLHGDGTGASPSERVEALSKDGNSIWNTATLDERVSLIRNMGLKDLKDEGFFGVSGQTYIQAYDPATNTFVSISSANPLYGLDSMDAINRNDIKTNLERLAAQMKSSTDNMQKIKIKKQDSNGNWITEEKNCSAAKNLKVIVVIPEDEGLAAIFKEVAAELGGSVTFEFQPSYGKVFKAGSGGD